MKIGSINKELLPMKAHYFLFNAGTAPVLPFLSIYARQLGFSSVVVGLIYTILPISGMIAKPTIGAIADYFKCQKLMFILGQLITAVAFLGILYAPQVPLAKTVHYSCSDSISVFDTSTIQMDVDKCIKTQLQNNVYTGEVECKFDCAMTPANWTIIRDHWKVTEYQNSHPNRLGFTARLVENETAAFEKMIVFRLEHLKIGQNEYTCSCGELCHLSTFCEVECDDYQINDMIQQPSIQDDLLYNQYQFWVFLTLMIIAWTGQAITVSVGDAICFEMLGDRPDKYGYQRLFGSIGWGIFSPIAGIMVDALSEGSAKKSFVSAFYLAAVFLIIDAVASYQLKYVQKKVSSNIFKDVGKLLMDLRILVFLVWCVCVGMCTGLIWNFLFWLVEDLAKNQGCDSQNWIKTLEGLLMAVDTLLGEIPLFFLSGWILKRIGHVHTMSLILLALGVRFILYSIITDPWWFLPIELLNGLTFGLCYACMASYASVVAPPGTEATMQGLVGAIFEGIGVSLGSFIAGVLFQTYGGVQTYRIFGVAALIVFIIHIAAQYLLQLRTSDKTDGGVKYASPKDALSELDDDQQELTLVGY